MAHYTMRADGTAADLAACLNGDPDIQGECMSLATQNALGVGGRPVAGDAMLLSDKDGDADGIYRGIFVTWPGSGGTDVEYKNYPGHAPEIRSSSPVSTWSDESGNVWSATVTTEPQQVFMDGQFGDRKIDLSTVQGGNEFDWFWAANVLYIYAATDPDSRYALVEAGDVTRGINSSGLGYITLDGLIFSHANAIGVFFYNCSHITCKNCTVQWAFAQGLNFGASAYYSDILIEDCIGRYNGTNGVNISSGNDASIADCTIRRVHAYENGRHQHNNPSTGYWNSEQRFNGGILSFSPGDDATFTNFVVEYCSAHDNGNATPQAGSISGNGFWFDSTKGTSGAPNYLRFSTSYENNACGVYCELADYTRVYGNVFYNNGKASTNNGFSPAGMKVLGRGGDANAHSAENNVFYNNIVSGCLYGIHCVTSEGFTETPTPHVTGNIFKNNIVVNSTVADLRAVDGGDNSGTHGTGNIYDNNCFGASPTFRWGTQEVSPYDMDDYTTYDSWETEHGEAWVQIEEDPVFTDSGSDDYTIAEGCPSIGSGDNLGSPYNIGLLPATEWVDAVVTDDRDDY